MQKRVRPPLEALLDLVELLLDDGYVVRLAPGARPRLPCVSDDFQRGALDLANMIRQSKLDVVTDILVRRTLPPVGLVALVRHLDNGWTACSGSVVASQMDSRSRVGLYEGGMYGSAKFC